MRCCHRVSIRSGARRPGGNARWLDTEALIKASEGAGFKTAWGDVGMRPCNHQMLTRGFVAEVMEPDRIPAAIRYWGAEFPYIGAPTLISREEMTIPPKETGNPRCA